MKKIKFIVTLTLLIAISSSCSKLNPDDIADKNQSQTNKNDEIPVSEWNLKNVSYDINLQFPNWSNLDYPVHNGGIEQLSNDLSIYFFDIQYEKTKKEKIFRIEFIEDIIWVNRSVNSDTPEAPCKTQSITVHNSDDFKKVMEDIFGQERDIIVEVDYGTFGATIYWTFQDC